MNKKELAQELGLSVQTISRYQDMGLPSQKDGGKRVFDFVEAEQWINDNIDRNSPGQSEKMTKQEAQKALNRIYDNLLKYVDWERMMKDLNKAG